MVFRNRAWLWSLLSIAAVAAIVVLFVTARTTRHPTEAAAPGYLDKVDVVPFASRLVCTMLTTSQQTNLKVDGWDGWDNVQLGGTTYWQAGDIQLERNGTPGWQGIIPGGDSIVGNTVSYSTETPVPYNPSVNPWTHECIPNLNTKTDLAATPISPARYLPKAPFEASSFGTGWVDPSAGDKWIYYYYDSVSGPNQVIGVGLARMCAVPTPSPSDCSGVNYLDSQRIAATPSAACTGAGATIAGCLFWRNDDCIPPYAISSASSFVEGGYVYVFLDMDRLPGLPPAGPGTPTSTPWPYEGTGLARTLLGNIGTVTSYEYYNGTPQQPWLGGTNGRCLMTSLWNQPLRSNSIDVHRSAFLGNKLLAVYGSGFASNASARTANSVQGPWSDASVLFECGRFLRQGDPSFPGLGNPGILCYNPRLHPQYGLQYQGQNLFITYSNEKSYRVYLQEVVLSKPVHQYTIGSGAKLYRLEGTTPPPNSTDDGIAFYAVQYPVDGLDGIHEWESGGVYRYQATAPAGTWNDDGVFFYAADPGSFPGISQQHGFFPSGGDFNGGGKFAPVYLWTNGSIERYSPLALAGFTRGSIAFVSSCPSTTCDAGGAVDSDYDGVTDGNEVNLLLTNPVNSDTDGDTTLDGADDNDGDTLTNAYEIETNLSQCYSALFGVYFKSDPLVADTDADGIGDETEVNTYHTCPGSAQTDGDGLPDNQELAVGTDPTLSDTDGDGLLDGFEVTYDACSGIDPLIYNSQASHPDPDADGLENLLEMANGTNPCAADTDADGLNDLGEVNLNVNPLVKDSDGDSCWDGREVGTDPTKGGQRDPRNPWDYFNPTRDGQNRIDDILAVRDHYHVDRLATPPMLNPDYDVHSDRGPATVTPTITPQSWMTGPADGTERVADILAITNQYHHDCS